MNYLYKLVLLSLLTSTNVLPQFIVNSKSILEDGIILNLSFQEEPYLLEGENKNIINFYRSIDESKANLPILPSQTIFFAIPPEGKVNVSLIDIKTNVINNVLPKANPEISLRNDTTVNYIDGTLNLFQSRTEFYPQEKFVIEGYTWIRNYYCAIIRINTHQYNWQKRQITEVQEAKIEIKFLEEKPYVVNTLPVDDFEKSLEKVIINFKDAQKFRSFPSNKVLNDSTGNWIDYSKEYVKLQIPDDGIYRIKYDDILNYGIPQSINPKTLKLYYKGKQQPIFVFGEDDNSLDQGDYIEFWAERNYRGVDYHTLVSQGEEYLTYLDIYSDTSLVWLTWDGDLGQRAGLINNYVPGLIDSITSHMIKIHLENDLLLWYYGFYSPRIQLPFWDECKTWVWKQVTNTGTSSSPFIANSIVPNTEVYTTSRLNSWATTDGLVTNAHKYGAKLNSTGIQDSIIFDFETIANLEATFNSNDLIEGTNNYRVSGMPNDSGYSNRALIDWIDIEYFQFTNAANDSLLITIPDSVSTQMRVIKVGNFLADSDSTIIYKIAGTVKKINSFQINFNTLTFTDTVSGGDKYFIIKNNYLNLPIFLKKRQFVNLRDQNRQADYMLITHSSLQPSASDYSGFIESNYSNNGNLNVETILVEDIYDEFGYGYLQPEPIKEFLKYAYFNWQSPKPVYLVLLGDCTYDYKNHFGLTPALRKKMLVPSYGNSVSDIWFTTWDTTNINIQQMLVGRIPVNNNEEVYRYLGKHQIYIQRSYDDWNKNFLLFSGGFPDDPNELEQIRQTNNTVLTDIIHPAPVGGEAVHFYKTISPPTNLGPYTAEEIQNGLDYGGLFISYVGHSGTRTWDNGITEPSDIKNAYDDRLPVVSDNGCSTGKFAEPDIDAFGELFLDQDPTGQAIAYLGNSSLGYTSTSFRMPELFYQ
ncbi:MAG: C25 family cysteine peptidase, partial [Ignavibacteriaceae bacterium]|nr:C25 family cysteine peptidase [Ignavibacteriaceae bacterium]